MKISKHLFTLISGLAFMATFISCESDITKVYVDPRNDIQLYGGSEDIILKAENPEALALTLYWDFDFSLQTTDLELQAPINAADITLQLSDSENFSSVVELVLDKGDKSRQFLCAELNAFLTRLNFSSEELSPLFIRIKSVLSANLEPAYSNLLSVHVKPYKLDMRSGKVLAADKSETEIILASPKENGIYTGFMGVAAWYNWWFLENNNMLWGNNGDTGVPFEASTNETHWNFWFPEDAGCYFVTLNTIENWWSALHIDSLEVDGDINGGMIYNSKTNQWTMMVYKPAGNYSVRISGKGALYNTTTDTYRAGAIIKDVAFSSVDGNIEFGEGVGADITVDLPGGETALVLDLNNPFEYIVTTGEAPDIPETHDDVLWLSGLDDGLSGEWNFNCYLTSYDSTAGKYAAVHLANSLWGWLLYTDDNWGGAMGTESSDPYSGKIVSGAGNIPAPSPGRYLVNVDLDAMSYSLNEVSQVWYTGLNDDWNIYPMTLTEGCVYEAQVEKYANSPWGVKILLRDDWSMWFGGSAGTLRYGWDGFDGDNELPEGKYILTVDLAKCTYTYRESSEESI